MKPANRKPLYRIVEEDILQKIRSGEWTPHTKLPSEQELVRQYGVSRITVLNALQRLATQGVLYRVPGRGTFVAEPAGTAEDAQAHSRQDSRSQADPSFFAAPAPAKRAIAFIIPCVTGLYAVNMIEGISACAAENGYQLIIAPSQDREGEGRLINELAAYGVSGFIIFPLDQQIYSDKILELKVSHFPLVLIDRFLPGVDTSFVVSDNFYGGHLAAQHLCQLGHRRILLLNTTPLPTTSSGDRMHGCREAIESAGGTVICLGDLPHTYEELSAYAPFQEAMQDDTITGIICTNNILNDDVYRYCRDNAIAIPEQKSLIAFGSTGADMGLGYGFFTYVSQKERDMGYNACAALLQTIENPNLPYEKETVRPELVVRHSTAAPRQDNSVVSKDTPAPHRRPAYTQI